MIPISSIPANSFTGAAAPLTMRNFQADLERTGGLKESGLASSATQGVGEDPFGTMMKKYVGTDKHAHSKPLAERNMVNAELGLHILERAQGIIKANKNNQGILF